MHVLKWYEIISLELMLVLRLYESLNWPEGALEAHEVACLWIFLNMVSLFRCSVNGLTKKRLHTEK